MVTSSPAWMWRKCQSPGVFGQRYQRSMNWSAAGCLNARRISDEERGRDMGRIVVTEFVSLDGVMEDPGGAEDYKYGGWTFEIERGEDGNRFKLDETNATEALLLGRRTYEGFAEAWPKREGEFADKFNEMPKYVVSSTLGEPEWQNTTVLSGDLAEEVNRIRESTDGDVVVHGSAQLVQALIERDLVDELRLMV